MNIGTFNVKETEMRIYLSKIYSDLHRIMSYMGIHSKPDLTYF